MWSLGRLTFHLYGFLIGLGVLVGAGVSARMARLVELKTDEIWNGLLWVVGGGMIGARLYHVVDYWGYYSRNLVEIVAVWQGGLGIFGGILGGMLGLWVYTRKKEIFLKMLDLVAFGLPVGQAIGRWGNFFNQELYGKPTSLPWGIYIRPENRLLSVIEYERFQPLFLYESLWCLGVFGVLHWLVKDKVVKLGKGRLFIFYLGFYGLGRFFLEFLRIESWKIYGVNVAQAISLGLVGWVTYWWRRRA
jgi:phosphatidylglycerol:prolipoprotein diacylglycerol transferase